MMISTNLEDFIRAIGRVLRNSGNLCLEFSTSRHGVDPGDMLYKNGPSFVGCHARADLDELVTLSPFSHWRLRSCHLRKSVAGMPEL